MRSEISGLLTNSMSSAAEAYQQSVYTPHMVIMRDVLGEFIVSTPMVRFRSSCTRANPPSANPCLAFTPLARMRVAEQHDGREDQSDPYHRHGRIVSPVQVAEPRIRQHPADVQRGRPWRIRAITQSPAADVNTRAQLAIASQRDSRTVTRKRLRSSVAPRSAAASSGRSSWTRVAYSGRSQRGIALGVRVDQPVQVSCTSAMYAGKRRGAIRVWWTSYTTG